MSDGSTQFFAKNRRLQVSELYDADQVFSIMNHRITRFFENFPLRPQMGAFTMISMSKVHSASLRLLRRPTSIIRYE